VASTLRVTGAEKVIGKLRKLQRTVPRAVEDGMYRLTSKAAEETRKAMPGWIWDTGNLASSIDNMVKWEKGACTGYVFTPVDYGIYVHFGTYKMKSRPFMDIALRVLQHPEQQQWAFKGILR
jgi:HK97 gp10 family phage protein